MKKICILLALILCCGFVQAQTISNSAKIMSFCGVPFGIDSEEFDRRAGSVELRDSIALMVGADNCRIMKSNVTLRVKPKIACTLEVTIGDKYGVWVLYGLDLLKNMLKIKYGDYQEFTDYQGRKMYVWKLSYGEVSLYRSDEDAVIHYYDYNALKKAFPSLLKML
uniref:hypothetical protein n=1 Tax=Alistipes sp. TaxID=1872444 RepID=UPI004056BDEF